MDHAVIWPTVALGALGAGWVVTVCAVEGPLTPREVVVAACVCTFVALQWVRLALVKRFYVQAFKQASRPGEKRRRVARSADAASLLGRYGV